MTGSNSQTPPPRPLGHDELVRAYVPVGVRVAAEWSWRLLLIAAAIAAFCLGVAYLRIVVVPLLIAGLLTALLLPLVNRLVSWHWPRVVAVLFTVLLILGVVTGLVWIIATQMRTGMSDMWGRIQRSVADAKVWLNDSPLHLTEDQINAYAGLIFDNVQGDSQALLDGAISVGSTAGHVFTGFLLTVFSTIFLLYDAHRIFGWLVRLFPARARAAVGGAGRAGWRTTSNYVRVQILVALVDAVGISIVAVFLQLPLILPMGILVFLASFVPFVGAIVSGFIVCLVALVYSGPLPALIMLAGVVAVQQLESHVLQPFIMGSAVRIHPLGVVLAVTIGALIAGIPGTLFAVPVAAASNTMIGYLSRREWQNDTHPAGTGSQGVVAASERMDDAPSEDSAEGR